MYTDLGKNGHIATQPSKEEYIYELDVSFIRDVISETAQVMILKTEWSTLGCRTSTKTRKDPLPLGGCLVPGALVAELIFNTCAVVAGLLVVRLKFNTFVPCLVQQHYGNPGGKPKRNEYPVKTTF